MKHFGECFIYSFLQYLHISEVDDDQQREILHALNQVHSREKQGQAYETDCAVENYKRAIDTAITSLVDDYYQSCREAFYTLIRRTQEEPSEAEQELLDQAERLHGLATVTHEGSYAGDYRDEASEQLQRLVEARSKLEALGDEQGSRSEDADQSDH
ncbi:MAG: hypothetical protein WKF89_04860 [Chitinophagaceae bacterium]